MANLLYDRLRTSFRSVLERERYLTALSAKLVVRVDPHEVKTWPPPGVQPRTAHRWRADNGKLIGQRDRKACPAPRLGDIATPEQAARWDPEHQAGSSQKSESK